MSNEVIRMTNAASEVKKFAVSADTEIIIRLILEVDDLYNKVSALLTTLYGERDAEATMANGYNEYFWGITDKLKGVMADNIHSSLCNLKNLVEDEIEI